MLNTLFGWYARRDLGCKFDTIVFAESIAASTTGYAVTLTSAQEGTAKKVKLVGHNFIITDLYTVCTTGLVDAKVLPDNDTSAKFYLQVYQPVPRKLPIPLLLMSDLVIEFDNNEGHINDAYIAFDGFWINEDKMPALTLLSELVPTALGNVDMQTLAIEHILGATAEAEGVVVPGYETSTYETPTYLKAGKEFREFCKRRHI
jgi:hypothetical protein